MAWNGFWQLESCLLRFTLAVGVEEGNGRESGQHDTYSYEQSDTYTYTCAHGTYIKGRQVTL